jgi:hypothetical protein
MSKEAERAEKVKALKWLTLVMTPRGEGAFLSADDVWDEVWVATKESGDADWYNLDDITILP